MLVDDLPESAYVGVVRNALEHERCRTVGKRAIYDVAVSRDPPDIRRRPVNIIFAQIKHDLVRECGIHEITAAGMQDAFGLTRRPGCVKDKERIFRIYDGCGTGLRLSRYDIVVPAVTRRVHWDRCAGAAHDQYVFDAFRTLDAQRTIDIVLERYALAAAQSFICGDDYA